jgi:hypothetical protein|tara:strand:- start:384 stop:989 length:606 start_codon:yes stop_codon:yes gene_type:complete
MSRAFENFFKSSNAKKEIPSERLSIPTDTNVPYALGSKHSGYVAQLLEFINSSRDLGPDDPRAITVLTKSGPISFSDISPKYIALIQSAWAKLLTKLDPRCSKIGKLPYSAERFIQRIADTFDKVIVVNILTSLAAYVAIHARLNARIQAITVVEPQWNSRLIQREAKNAVGQIMFYLCTDTTAYATSEGSPWADDVTGNY